MLGFPIQETKWPAGAVEMATDGPPDYCSITSILGCRMRE